MIEKENVNIFYCLMMCMIVGNVRGVLIFQRGLDAKL